MVAEVQELWDSAEARKWRVLEAVARLPEARQGESVRGKWSPRQIVLHLVMAEEQQLREIAAAAGRTEVPRPSWKHRSLVWVLRKGVRVPAPPSMVPGEAPELPELTERWNRVRAELRAAFEGATDSRPFAYHEILGPLSAEQVLQVTDSHLQYHQRDVGA